MPILDIFKKEKPEEPEKRPESKKVEKKKPVLSKERKKSGMAFQILTAPHITEKAVSLEAKDQYVFRVWQKANRCEVKKAVEDVYNVNVEAVRIINIPRKERRLGKTIGFKKGYKKAIVKLEKGQKIEILPR